jgi:hypothetical protein
VASRSVHARGVFGGPRSTGDVLSLRAVRGGFREPPRGLGGLRERRRRDRSDRDVGDRGRAPPRCRSEYAYPARLRLVCALCLREGRIADPEEVVGNDAWLVPMCSSHLKKEGATGPPAAEVQSELLSTYAVEVLPKPKFSRLAPQRTPLSIGLQVARGLFAVIRFAIGALFMLWAFSGILLVAFGGRHRRSRGGLRVEPPGCRSPRIRDGESFDRRDVRSERDAARRSTVASPGVGPSGLRGPMRDQPRDMDRAGSVLRGGCRPPGVRGAREPEGSRSRLPS